MKILKPALTIAFLLGTLACGNAWAQHRGGGHFHGGYHGRVGVGVVVGAPLFWPGYWYDPFYDPYLYPRYYAAPVYVQPDAPPTYVERGNGPQTWYYCSNPSGYYPYVKQCSVPWRSVDPSTVPPQQK